MNQPGQGHFKHTAHESKKIGKLPDQLLIFFRSMCTDFSQSKSKDQGNEDKTNDGIIHKWFHKALREISLYAFDEIDFLTCILCQLLRCGHGAVDFGQALPCPENL